MPFNVASQAGLAGPTIISVNDKQTVVISGASGGVKAGQEGGGWETMPPAGPDGYTGLGPTGGGGYSDPKYPGQNFFPSRYIPGNVYLAQLVGTFADSRGRVVGSPFGIGTAMVTKQVPPGATRLQLGVNDALYLDNTGAFAVDVKLFVKLAVDANPPEGGTVTGEGIYLVHSEQVISATPAEGWEFKEWNDEIKTNPRTVLVPKSGDNYAAIFQPAGKVTVKFRYGSDTQGVYFLSGVPLQVDFTASSSSPHWTNFEWQVNGGGWQRLGANASFDVGSAFGIGGHLQVRGVSADGSDVSDACTAKFEVISVPPSVTPADLTVSGDGALTYKSSGATLNLGGVLGRPSIGNDLTTGSILPFLSGTPFDVSLLPKYDITVYGAGFARGNNVHEESDSESEKNRFRFGKLALKARYSSSTSSTDGVAFSWKYDGAKWNVGGSFGITLQGGESITQPLVLPAGPVPLPAYVTLSYNTTSTGIIDVTGVLDDNLQFGGGLAITPTITAAAGIGYAKILNGEIQVQGTGKLHAEWHPTATLQELGADLTVDLRANYFGKWTPSKQLYSYSWNGLAAGAAPPMLNMKAPWGPPMVSLTSGLEDWRLADRQTARVEAPPAAALSFGSTSGEVILQSDCFPQSQCALARANGVPILFRIVDDSTRSSVNRNKMVWQKLGGTWSDPLALQDDGTADSAPTVGTLANGLVLVGWQNTSLVLPNTATLPDEIAAQEICVAALDPQTGATSTTRLTNNGYLDYAPSMAVGNDGTGFVAWIQNPNGSVIGSAANPNRICAAFYDGSAWQPFTIAATQLGAITQLTAGYVNGVPTILVSRDMDDELSTSVDRELFAIQSNGTTWGAAQRLTNDGVQDSFPQIVSLPSNQQLIAWLRGGKLYAANNLNLAAGVEVSTSGTGGFDDLSSCADVQGQVYITTTGTPGGSNPGISVFQRGTGGAWNGPISVASDSDFKRSVASTANGQGDLVLAYNKVHSTTDPAGDPIIESVDLAVYRQLAGADLMVSELKLNPEQPAVGVNVMLAATVVNTGLTATNATSVGFAIRDGINPDVVLGNAALPALRPGVVATVTIPWMAVSASSDRQIVATVDPGNAIPDVDRGNNQFAVEPFVADLDLTELSLQVFSAGMRQATAQIKNIGLTEVPAGVTLTAYLSSTSGPVLASKPLNDPIPAGGSVKGLLQWNTDALSGSSGEGKVVVVVNPDGIVPEFHKDNNGAGGSTPVESLASPVISQQPDPREAIDAGGNVWLSVGAAETGGPYAYQWQYKAGSAASFSDIPGATSQWLQVDNLQASSAGSYRVVVTNANGTTTSNPTDLSITNLKDAADAPGLSFRTRGTVLWRAQTTVTHDGVDALQLGPLAWGEWSSLDVTVPGPGRLEYWLRTSGGHGQFWKGGSWSDLADTGGSWVKQTVWITEEYSQFLTWVLQMDAEGANMQIDEVVFTPAAELAPIVVFQPDPVEAVDAGFFATLGISLIDAGGPFTFQWQREVGTSGVFVNIAGATQQQWRIDQTQASDAGSYRVVVTNAHGSTTSEVLHLTVANLQAATDEPAIRWRTRGATLAHAQTAVTHDGVDALEVGPMDWGQNWSTIETRVPSAGRLSYWIKVSGAHVDVWANGTQSTIEETGGVWELRSIDVTDVDGSDLGWVVQMDTVGATVYFDQFVFTSAADLPPLIASQPDAAYRIDAGGMAEFQVEVVPGGEPYVYQWQRRTGGASVFSDIVGANEEILELPNVQAAEVGEYRVIIANAHGSTTSSVSNLGLTDFRTAADSPELLWRSRGSAEESLWRSQTITSHDGVDALQIPASSGYSLLEALVPEAGRLTFWVRVSGGRLEVYDNWEREFAVEDTGGQWVQRTLDLSDDEAHLVSLNFQADETGATAWLDQAVYTSPAGLPPILTQDPTPAQGIELESFTWDEVAAVAAGGPFTYQWQKRNGTSGVFANVPGATSARIDWDHFQAAEAGVYRAVVTNARGSVTSDTLTLSAINYRNALNTPGIEWWSYGDRLWQVQTAVTHDGVEALSSGTAADEYDSETNVEGWVEGPGMLTFWWKVSSEAGWDFLRLYVDGVKTAEISGEVNWTRLAVPIPPGGATIRIQYEKDDEDSEGADAGYVDQIALVAPGSYDEWRAVYFTAAELADAAVSGFDSDGNRNGLANGVEAALLLDPKAVGAGTAVRTFLAGAGVSRHLVLSFDLPTTALAGLILDVEEATGLKPATWNSVATKSGSSPWASTTTVSETPIAGGRTRVEVHSTLTSSRAFMRLKVRRN